MHLEALAFGVKACHGHFTSSATAEIPYFQSNYLSFATSLCMRKLSR